MISSVSSSSSSSQFSSPELKRMTPPKRSENARERLSEAECIIRIKLQGKMFYKTGNPEIVSFIGQLINNLDEKNNATEISKLEEILKNPKSVKYYDYYLSMIRLYTLNENNPIIETLKSLDPIAIDRLRKIDVPPFFPNFFEELEFYISINTVTVMSTPEDKIKTLIPLIKKQLDAGKKDNAFKLIDIAKSAIYDQSIPPAQKVALLQKIALLFLKHENQKIGVQILKKAQIAAINIKFPSIKDKMLKELAESYVHFLHWDSVIQIINEVLQTANPLRKASIAQQKENFTIDMFVFIEKHAGIDVLLQIAPQCVDCREKDMALIAICLTSLDDPRKIEEAVRVASLIQSDDLKTLIKKDIRRELLKTVVEVKLKVMSSLFGELSL